MDCCVLDSTRPHLHSFILRSYPENHWIPRIPCFVWGPWPAWTDPDTWWKSQLIGSFSHHLQGFIQGWFNYNGYTPWNWQVLAHENRPSSIWNNRIPTPSIFRCEVMLVSGRVNHPFGWWRFTSLDFLTDFTSLNMLNWIIFWVVVCHPTIKESERETLDEVPCQTSFMKIWFLYTGSMPTPMPPHAYADCTGCLRPRFLILGAYAGASAGFFVG